MNLPNAHFTDFPIEFKEINPEDFPHFEVENNREKIIIFPNEEGYISEQLLSNINLGVKNTVVVNAAVGQGKSYSVIEIVKKYYDEFEDSLIFIASPFVSLVSQYYNDVIVKGILEEDVFRYETLGNENIGDYLNKRVHIVTANCLLGNPGEDAFINSEVKRSYLNTLAQHCRNNDKKVVIIYDEIHDTIYNFKEKYIFNLWRWKSVIHKNIIISATYNEASKVVIEYLAELTDDRIQIIESARIRYREKQSELYLHYNPALNYKNTNEAISNLVKNLIVKGKEIDILSFSKKLAESIIEDNDEGISKELYKKYNVINSCTSELILNQRGDRTIPQNRYNNEMCNVGTNFKTGVNITKDNHAFIIIMPPRSSRLPFQNLYGIFSSGIISVIQAIARQRKKGEIHIILPRPDEFKYDSLPFEGELKQVFVNCYEALKHYVEPKQKVKYYSFQEQRNLLCDFYNNTLKANIHQEINLVESTQREGKASLKFPEFKNFLLDEGEDYLAFNKPFFGGDLSAYITYAALTNQFINCSLKDITFKATLFFEEGKIQQELETYNKMYFVEDINSSLYQYLNNYSYYLQYRSDIFHYYKVILKIGDKWHSVKPNGTSIASTMFELQLLGFIQRRIHPNNDFNRGTFYDNNQLIEGLYERSQYFLDCISQTKDIDLNTSEFSALETKRIKSFKFLDKLRKKLIGAIQTTSTRNESSIKYLPNKSMANFIEGSDLFKYREMLSYFLEEDFFLNLNIYEFKRRFENKTELKKIETLYRIILEDFFIVEDYRLTTGRRPWVKKIMCSKILPQQRNVINLISSAEYDFPELFLDNITMSSEEIRSLIE